MRIPVTIVSGFLGSGKTTLLNHLLSASHGRKLAVIVNEFGDVGIDSQLVAGGEQFVELDNGCLCCALNEDLEQLVRDLHARGGFDGLVLETTGIADPLPVAWTFSRPGLSSAYRVDAIVTVVDALNLEKVIDQSMEAKQQIERADILVLNKLDLVPDAGHAARQRIVELNPAAVVLEAEMGHVDHELLLGTNRHSETTPSDAHHHHAYESWSFVTSGVLDEAKLEDFLYEVPEAVYRLKGVVNTNAEWGWTIVHCVAGRFDIYPYKGDPPAQSALVFIGKDLPKDELATECEQFLVKP